LLLVPPLGHFPRAPKPLANEAGVAGRASPAVELVPTPPGPRDVVAGRATTVPLTAVLTGPRRTPTDNPTAATTCGDHHIPSWRTCPIWLCKQGVGRSRLALVLPASCSRRPSPCAWFEPTRGWGITMPLTRDSPSIQGMSLAQTPPGPPSKAVAGRGSLVGGSRRGSTLLGQGPPGGAPLPPRAGVPGPRWATPHRKSSSHRQPSPTILGRRHCLHRSLGPAQGIRRPEGRHAGRASALRASDSLIRSGRVREALGLD
jgi:hypothetical protein